MASVTELLGRERPDKTARLVEVVLRTVSAEMVVVTSVVVALKVFNPVNVWLLARKAKLVEAEIARNEDVARAG